MVVPSTSVHQPLSKWKFSPKWGQIVENICWRLIGTEWELDWFFGCMTLQTTEMDLLNLELIPFVKWLNCLCFPSRTPKSTWGNVRQWYLMEFDYSFVCCLRGSKCLEESRKISFKKRFELYLLKGVLMTTSLENKALILWISDPKQRRPS